MLPPVFGFAGHGVEMGDYWNLFCFRPGLGALPRLSPLERLQRAPESTPRTRGARTEAKSDGRGTAKPLTVDVYDHAGTARAPQTRDRVSRYCPESSATVSRVADEHSASESQMWR